MKQLRGLYAQTFFTFRTVLVITYGNTNTMYNIITYNFIIKTLKFQLQYVNMFRASSGHLQGIQRDNISLIFFTFM